MLNFNTKPVPHAQARKIIAEKPGVTRDVFDRLPEEIQANAFLITGVEDFDVLQGIRDRIADLPAGANWDDVKKDIAADLSPWFSEKGAESRANILLRHHGINAYAATEKRVMDSLRDVFPYIQYHTDGGPNVRASHAALNGIILPAEHPFWDTHWGSWEWGCHCFQTGLTGEDMEEEKQRDGKRPVHQRRVLGGRDRAALEDGELHRGGLRADVRTQRQRNKAAGKPGGYEVRAGHIGIDYSQIKTRWDKPTRQAFEAWADGQVSSAAGDLSLLDVLLGRKPTPGKFPLPGSNNPLPENPVSAALKLVIADKATRASAERAIRTVDSVHGDGVLPPIKIDGGVPKGAVGLYKRTPEGDPFRIGIKKVGPWKELTTAHEIAHFLDDAAIGGPGGFESGKKGGLLAGVLDAIERSEAYKVLLVSRLPHKNKAYLLSKKELWARAYAQYIAEQSADKTMLSQLDKVSKGSEPYRHWHKQDFAPISKQITALLEKLQWTNSK